jgi:hypothetical protein
MKTLIPTLIAVTLVTAPVHAQHCNDRIDMSAPTGRYTDHGDGTVTDLRTGLRWQRCPQGYSFDANGTPALMRDDRCNVAGTVLVTWQEALNGAVALNQSGGYAGFTDWRLPNLKELASIVETKCIAPSINQTVFPDTPQGSFFSATPYTGPSDFVSTQGVDFMSGEDTQISKPDIGLAGTGYVRLVR